MANRLKQIWAEGKSAVNGWLAIPSGFSAENVAQCGFDTVTVDLQHGVQDYMSMVACFQAMQAHPITPMVRVPWNEPGIIGRVLDAGALGVICPMINTADEARAFVSSSKYPPDGARSNGPIRAGNYFEGGAYQDTANAECLSLPMIETRAAMENLDAILDVPGIAGVYVGPSDLAFSHGLRPKLDREEPEMLRLFERIIEAAGKHGLPAGLHCGTPEYAARALGMGFRLVTLLNEVSFMRRALTQGVQHVRQNSNGVA